MIYGPFEYETVAASQTAQVLGATGASGDYLEMLIISIVTVATGSVTLIDGGISIVLTTGAATLPMGIIMVPVRCRSVNGPWKITTGAGATVLATGLFT